MNALSARQNDAVIAICQNNAAQTITVSIANEEAAEMLGYDDSAALHDTNFLTLVSEKVREAILENVEFEDDSHDVDQVLARSREFKMIHQDGREVACDVKVTRMMAPDGNHHFRLVLRDDKAKREENMLIRAIHDNLAGYAVMDEALMVPNRQSTFDFLKTVVRHVSQHELSACFAVVRLDRYEKSIARYGEDGTNEQLRFVIEGMIRNFRSDDVICYLGNGLVGIVLFNIPHDSVRVVLNRLRWNIATRKIEYGGKKDFSITVSITFKYLSEDDEAEDIVDRCETLIASIDVEKRGEMNEFASA